MLTRIQPFDTITSEQKNIEKCIKYHPVTTNKIFDRRETDE